MQYTSIEVADIEISRFSQERRPPALRRNLIRLKLQKRPSRFSDGDRGVGGQRDLRGNVYLPLHRVKAMGSARAGGIADGADRGYL